MKHTLKLRIKLEEAVTAALETFMVRAVGCTQIKQPFVFGCSPRIGEPTLQFSSSSFAINIGTRSILLEAFKEVGDVFCVHKILRDDLVDENHLTEFTYLFGISEGGVKQAEMIVNGLLAAGYSAAAGVGLPRLPLIQLPLQQCLYSELIENKRIDDKKLSLDAQKKIISTCGNVPCLLFGLPDYIEPCMWDAVIKNGTPQTFDILAPFCGEIGSGHELNIQTLSLTDSPAGDTSEPYINTLLGVDKPICTWGLSIERLIQFLLSERVITKTLPFQYGVGGHHIELHSGSSAQP